MGGAAGARAMTMAVRTRVDSAMVLAAGLGTRMRPITNTLPKPLVRVAGKTLLDHVLDPMAEAGITRAVVNVHHLPEQIEAHVAERTHAPQIILSDERAQILDSGGGVALAAGHLGETLLIRNADSFWIDQGPSNLARMIAAYDPARMDTLLLLATRENSVGFDGKGDFFMDGAGLLTRRGESPSAPFIYAGAAIMPLAPFKGRAGEIFSLNALWNEALAKGRLFGLVLDGLWLHVGTPDAITLAEEAIARSTRA